MNAKQATFGGVLTLIFALLTPSTSVWSQEGTTEMGLDDVSAASTGQTSIVAKSAARETDPPANDVDSEKPQEKAFDYTTLFDEPEKLKKLDRIAPIWVSTDRDRVALGGKICLRDGMLEFFACRKDSKEHESIVALDIPPHLIHAALLVIGAKQGAPAKFNPKFVPPSGDEIEILVRWRDEKTNEIRQIRAQEMVKDEVSDKAMESPWVFTGGLFGVDPDGKKYYLANVTGEVFGVANFPGSVLDVPFESSSDNSQLSYAANTEKIPPIDSDVLLILSRAKKDENASNEKQ